MNRRDAIKALMSLPATATITRASLKPTDVIVVEYDGPLSKDTIGHIERQMKQVWPDHKCVVVCGGLRLKIAEGRPV